MKREVCCEHHNERLTISRNQCMALNDMALNDMTRKICEEDTPRSDKI